MNEQTDLPIDHDGSVSPDLHELADKVENEAMFIDFISALATDRRAEVDHDRIAPSSPYGPGSRGWENGTIESFLAAAADWASASRNGLPAYRPPSNAWKRCAEIMLMGKHYE
jgi:hypothetical protein